MTELLIPFSFFSFSLIEIYFSELILFWEQNRTSISWRWPSSCLGVWDKSDVNCFGDSWGMLTTLYRIIGFIVSNRRVSSTSSSMGKMFCNPDQLFSIRNGVLQIINCIGNNGIRADQNGDDYLMKITFLVLQKLFYMWGRLPRLKIVYQLFNFVMLLVYHLWQFLNATPRIFPVSAKTGPLLHGLSLWKAFYASHPFTVVLAAQFLRQGFFSNRSRDSAISQ